MLIAQLLGGLFGLGLAYAMDYFLVTKPMKIEEEKVRQELLEVRSKLLNRSAGTK
jgi:hypothetical protein